MIDYGTVVVRLLGGLTDGRIHPCVADQGAQAPYQIYEYKVTGEYTKDGLLTDTVHLSLYVYSNTMKEAIRIAKEARKILEAQEDAETMLAETDMYYDEAGYSVFVLKMSIQTDPD